MCCNGVQVPCVKVEARSWHWLTSPTAHHIAAVRLSPRLPELLCQPQVLPVSVPSAGTTEANPHILLWVYGPILSLCTCIVNSPQGWQTLRHLIIFWLSITPPTHTNNMIIYIYACDKECETLKSSLCLQQSIRTHAWDRSDTVKSMLHPHSMMVNDNPRHHLVY